MISRRLMAVIVLLLGAAAIWLALRQWYRESAENHRRR